MLECHRACVGTFLSVHWEVTITEAAYMEVHGPIAPCLWKQPQQQAEAGTRAVSFLHAFGQTRAQRCKGHAHPS